MISGKIVVPKTARYFLSRQPDDNIRKVVFVLHGYAQLANEFLESFGKQENDILLIAPEGLHRFYGKGATGKVVASWMTKEERQDDILDYVNYLDLLYRNILELLPDRVEVMLLGFSQGAATASRWCSLGNSKFSKLILWCGFFPPDLPVEKFPKDIQLYVYTASDDRFIDEQEREKQLRAISDVKPDFRHIHFNGEHTIVPELFLQFMKSI
ncbi:MAG: esterase [Bacteroidia bacterium]